MSRTIFLFITAWCCTNWCSGQDTILIEPGYYYTSKQYPIKDINFYNLIKHAREDIVYSDRHKSIDYCYYYDGERNCYGNDHLIVNDSILQLDDNGDWTDTPVYWIYHKADSGYLVHRYYSGTCEYGFVKSLIPFERTGIFTTTNISGGDTLWTADYSQYNPHSPYDKAGYHFYTSHIQEKIFDAAKVDNKPTFPNGDSLPAISLKRADFCINEPYYRIHSMSFVVTSSGSIKNIKQEAGSFNDWCPYYLMDLTRLILKWGKLKPAVIHGENVNVKWVIPVTML